MQKTSDLRTLQYPLGLEISMVREILPGPIRWPKFIFDPTRKSGTDLLPDPTAQRYRFIQFHPDYPISFRLYSWFHDEPNRIPANF